MQGQEASLAEKASQVEAASCSLEVGGREVSVDGEGPWVAVCLQVVGWEACWGQSVGVQKEVGVGVLSLFQREEAAAAVEAAGLATLVSGQARVQMSEQEPARVQDLGTALPAGPFCFR